MSLTPHKGAYGKKKACAGWLLAGVLAIWTLSTLPVAISHAGTVEGSLSLSTTGDTSGEVFFGSGEEVRLLRPEFARERDELRRRILPRIREADRLADSALVKLLRSSVEERRQNERSYRAAEEQRRKTRQDYESAINTLIPKFTVMSAKADDQGRFRFEDVTPGKYLILSQKVMRELGLFYHWLVEVQAVGQEATSVELTRKNAASLYY